MADVINNAFLLGEATLMIAPFGSASVFDLQPSLHSVGMVKNVQLTQEADTVELRKGVQQLLVDSKKSNVKTTLSAEVFEYSAQNLYYAMSMGSVTPVAPKRGRLKTAITGAVSTIVVNTDPLPGQSSTGIAAIGDIPNGATLLLQVPKSLGGNDLVFPVRVTASTTVSSADYTVTVAVPVGFTFPAGTKVWVVNEVPVSPTAEQDFFSVKVVGTLANYERPVALVLPKVKVKRGFTLNFSETEYVSMPFEFDPYFLTTSEISGRLAEIGTQQQGTVYIP